MSDTIWAVKKQLFLVVNLQLDLVKNDRKICNTLKCFLKKYLTNSKSFVEIHPVEHFELNITNEFYN